MRDGCLGVAASVPISSLSRSRRVGVSIVVVVGGSDVHVNACDRVEIFLGNRDAVAVAPNRSDRFVPSVDGDSSMQWHYGRADGWSFRGPLLLFFYCRAAETIGFVFRQVRPNTSALFLYVV